MNKIKRINALILATCMLGSYTVAKSDNNPDRIEKYTLTQEERLDPNYSYLINDDYENILTEEEVVLYNQLVNNILNRKRNIRLSSNDESNIRVIKAIEKSHYNAFIKNYNYNTQTNELHITYLYTREEQERRINLSKEESTKIFDELFEEDMNTMDKLIVLYQYAVNNFKYNMIYPREYIVSGKSHMMYTDFLLEKNSGVCHTYAFFFDYYCQHAGIDSYLLLGYAGKTYHMWNMVRLDDGKFYMLDLTSAIIKGKLIKNTFDCFGITKQEFKGNVYSIPKEDRLLSINIKCSQITELRYFEKAEYLGNHIFKVTDKYNNVSYYNTEIRTISENLDEVKTLTK